jgi:hypothetical protein
MDRPCVAAALSKPLPGGFVLKDVDKHEAAFRKDLSFQEVSAQLEEPEGRPSPVPGLSRVRGSPHLILLHPVPQGRISTCDRSAFTGKCGGARLYSQHWGG